MISVSNALKPQRRFTISGLSPSEVYQLRVEAHNVAGSSAAEFTAVTLTEDGQLPPADIVHRSKSYINIFLQNRVLVSATIAAAALLIAIGTLAYCFRNSKYRRPFIQFNRKYYDLF